MTPETTIYPGGRLTILESVDSTNNYAMAALRTGLATQGDAFLAMAQTQGRGQHGKSWITEPGTNLIISLILRPARLFLHQQPLFNCAVALGVYDFFNFYTGSDCCIKWPNDLYWRDRKAAGILVENIFGREADPAAPDGPAQWQWAVAGMGININQVSFPDQAGRPVSLRQITGKTYELVPLATRLCSLVQQRVDALDDPDLLLAAYNEQLYKRGEIVLFRKESRVFEARVEGVDRQGKLELDTGLKALFSTGEVEWVLP